jgi:hypothetical protein
VRTISKRISTLMVAVTLNLVGSAHAHNVDPMPWIVPSFGVMSAAMITIDGSDSDWPVTATSFPISDYGAIGGGIAPLPGRPSPGS